MLAIPLGTAEHCRAPTLYQAEAYAEYKRAGTVSTNIHRSDTDPSNNKRGKPKTTRKRREAARENYSVIAMCGWGASARSPTVTPST